MARICSICKYETNDDRQYCKHMFRFHKFDANFKVSCGFCTKSFTKVNSFRRHVKRKHTAINEDVTDGEEEGFDFDDGYVNIVQDERTDSRWQAAKFLLGLKARHNITDTAIDEILETTQQFISDILRTLRNGVDAILRDNNVDITIDYDTIFDEKNMFNSLGSAKARKEYYLKYFQMLEPRNKLLGEHWVWKYVRTGKSQGKKKGNTKKRKRVKVQDYCYYIPLLDNLQNMLRNPDVLTEVENPHNNEDILGDFCDGQIIKTHPIFEANVNALQIIGYYDDIEIANPLGSKATKHKLGCFYWTLGNIHPKFRSTMRAIQVFAICKTSAIKLYGVDQILRPFVNDLNQLARDEGVSFLTFHGMRTFRGTLVAFLGDTPAANLVAGFKGVGGTLRMCRTCYCVKSSTQNEIATKFTHDNCELREIHRHIQHASDINDDNLTAEAQAYWSKFWGVNRLSVLNEIRYFNLCKCMPHDIMHILLEGAVAYEMKLLLWHAIDELELFTINWLCDQINTMNLTGLEAKDRPSSFDRRYLNSNGHKLNQSAAQMMTLCNILPYIIGHMLPEEDRYWYCMRLMLMITNFCLSLELERSDAAVLATLIQEHHVLFVNLYGEESLTPKMHYMVHLPDQIIEFGPLKIQWCMRFEAKHHFFKKSMVNKSFKNVALSMAGHHQHYSCHQLLLNPGQQSSNFLDDGFKAVIDENPIEIPDNVKETLNNLTENGDIQFSVATQLEKNGILYAVGNVVLLDMAEDSMPVFGYIMKILVLENEAILFLIQKTQTVRYSSAYLSYNIVNADEMKLIIQFSDLLHLLPLFPHEVLGNVYVKLRNSPHVEFIDVDDIEDQMQMQ